MSVPGIAGRHVSGLSIYRHGETRSVQHDTLVGTLSLQRPNTSSSTIPPTFRHQRQQTATTAAAAAVTRMPSADRRSQQTTGSLPTSMTPWLLTTPVLISSHRRPRSYRLTMPVDPNNLSM